jgi:hypothetical protein
MTIQRDQNESSNVLIQNVTNGTLAASQVQCISGTTTKACAAVLYAVNKDNTIGDYRTSGYCGIYAGGLGATQFVIYGLSAVPTVFYTASVDRMRILAGSNTLQGNAGLTLQGGAANGNALTLSATAGTVGAINFCNTGTTNTMSLTAGGVLLINVAAAVSTEKACVAGAIFPSGDAVASMTLGNASYRWAGVFAASSTIGDLNLRSEDGEAYWSVIEQKDSIKVRNNNTGKEYKMVLEDW